MLADVPIQRGDLAVLKTGDVDSGLRQVPRGAHHQQVADLEGLEPCGGQLRIGEGVLHRRVAGAHYGLTGGQMVRVRLLQPVPGTLGVHAEHRIGALLAHHLHDSADQLVSGSEEAVALVELNDPLKSDDGGGLLLLLLAQPRRLFRGALGVEPSRVAGGEQAQRGLDSAVGQRGKSGRGPEVDVVGVGGEGHHPAQPESLHQLVGVDEPVHRSVRESHRRVLHYIEARVTSIS